MGLVMSMDPEQVDSLPFLSQRDLGALVRRYDCKKNWKYFATHPRLDGGLFNRGLYSTASDASALKKFLLTVLRCNQFLTRSYIYNECSSIPGDGYSTLKRNTRCFLRDHYGQFFISPPTALLEELSMPVLGTILKPTKLCLDIEGPFKDPKSLLETHGAVISRKNYLKLLRASEDTPSKTARLLWLGIGEVLPLDDPLIESAMQNRESVSSLLPKLIENFVIGNPLNLDETLGILRQKMQRHLDRFRRVYANY